MSEFSRRGPKAIASTEELLAYSLALETEAVERFNDLADQMEVHHNYEVAELFQKLAKIEGIHIDNVNQAAEDRVLPEIAAWEYEWPEGESPEGGAMEEAHYLMEPWHAIEMAMQGEKRAVAFFQHVAETATDRGVIKMALDLVEEEQEHVQLLQHWQKKFPRPEHDWDEDFDPPNISE